MNQRRRARKIERRRVKRKRHLRAARRKARGHGQSWPVEARKATQ